MKYDIIFMFTITLNHYPITVLRTCTSDEYECASGQCISPHLRCDLQPDCADRSDEENCGLYKNANSSHLTL